MISIIIPALNEADNIARLILALQAMRSDSRVEIIVGDGGSADETVGNAQRAGVQVVRAERNRGRQLNAGARAATGEVLWFLHADARPHCGSLRTIEAAQESGCIGGNFRLKFQAHGLAPRIFECIAYIQARAGICYGDSGLWATREAFETLGGFQDWPLFEDYDFARRQWKLARQTKRGFHLSRLPIRVSARRFHSHPWRTLGLWLRLQLKFWLGVSPERLAREYHRIKLNEPEA